MRRTLTLLPVCLITLQAQTTSPAFPMTGREVPALLPYETAVRKIMEKWSVPGAVLAIVEGNRLIYVRGLGYADRESGEAVRPTSRFRLASISKTMAGMTILKLAEEGKINLDAPFMNYIPDLKATATRPPDPRMAQVTVRQLLQHTGGFDRPIEDDHVVYYNTASRLFNEPVSNDLMTRYVISQQLDFAPGTKYAYGNSGYQILGRVIERVTGKKFVEAIYDRILRPAGVTSVELGGNLLSQRLPDEVRYYDYPGAPLTTTAVAPGVTLPAPRPYNWRVDMADSYGGLVSNAIDLMRYLLALEGRRGTSLLSQSTLSAMVARPVPAVHPANGNYAGLTWRIVPTTGGQHWWHSGGAAGTRNLLVRRQNGRSWVVLTNTRPLDDDAIITELFEAMLAAEGQVREWPTHDLFTEYSGPALSMSAQSLSFTHSAGSNPPEAQQLQVTATVAGATVTVDAPTEHWLRTDRLSGPAPLSLSVSVDPAGLAPGDYRAQLRVSVPNGANGPRLIPVTLRVNPAPAFSEIRNSASRLSTRVAAPDSRIVVEAEAEEMAASADSSVVVRVIDSAAAERVASIVHLTPKSVDFVIPEETALGDATVEVLTAKGRLIRDRIQIAPVSPALFSANGDGIGAALATFTRTTEDGSSSSQPAYVCGESPGSCVPAEIDLGAETDVVTLQLAATGIRSLSDPAAFSVRTGDEAAEVVGIERSTATRGVDLVTIRLSRSLTGRGELDVVLTAADLSSNAVKVLVK